MLSILLVNPPVTIAENAPRALYPPLGLAYLAAVLESQFEVRILDCVAEGSMKEVPVEPGFVRLGLTPDEIELRIGNEPVAVVAIGCVSSDQIPNTLLVAECVKNLRLRRFLDMTVVVGGPGFTASPYDVMTSFNVDYGVLGEGEIPMFQLCSALYARRGWEEVAGVAFRDHYGTITINEATATVEDVDQIPPPARNLLNMQRYFFGPSYYGQAITPHTSMVLSRGCYSDCVYCAVPRIFGKVFRKRSPQLIFEELEAIRHEYAVREVEFIGDNLFHERDWAHEWMTEMIEAGLDMKWSTMSGQSLHNFDLDTASLAVQSGMRSVWLDVTSGDGKAYDNLFKRPGDLDDVVDLVRFLKRSRVYVGGLFTVGVPGETKESMARSVARAFAAGFHEIEFRVMTPFPGTPLWDECAEKGHFELVPDAVALLHDRGYVKTGEFNSVNALWQRDWARAREETRRLVSHPSAMTAQLSKFAMKGLFHPLSALKTVYRFAKLAGGTPLPEPQGAPQHGATPAPAPAAEPSDEDF